MAPRSPSSNLRIRNLLSSPARPLMTTITKCAEPGGLEALSEKIAPKVQPKVQPKAPGGSNYLKGNPLTASLKPPRPHHFHVYAHKHNTHISLTAGNRNPIISMSTGQLQFRKHNRGTFDAAYQLAMYILAQIGNKGLYNDGCDPKLGPIKSLEIILRGFGPGREAVTKVLQGDDAAIMRTRIVRVMDSTRIKFGGTRSKKPRRLG